MRELAENVIVLLFVDARCQLCSRLLSSMCTAGPGAVPVLTIVGGHGGTGRRMAERCGCDPEWTVEEPGARRLRSRFRISGVPSVTVLAAGRVVGTCSPASADAVRALLARIRSVA